MFDKKEPHNLLQLKEGYSLTVQNNKYVIKEVIDYDWGVDGKSTEYAIKADNETITYLEVERYDGDYEITHTTPVSLTDFTLREAINSKSIVYNSVVFELEEQYQGATKNQTLQSSWENVKNYIFYSEAEEMIIIEAFAGKELKAYYGQTVQEKTIKNIKA